MSKESRRRATSSSTGRCGQDWRCWCRCADDFCGAGVACVCMWGVKPAKCWNKHWRCSNWEELFWWWAANGHCIRVLPSERNTCMSPAPPSRTRERTRGRTPPHLPLLFTAHASALRNIPRHIHAYSKSRWADGSYLKKERQSCLY